MPKLKIHFLRKTYGPGGGKTSGDLFERLLSNYVEVTPKEEADIIHNYDGSLEKFSKPTVFVVNSWKYTCPACIQCTTYNNKICEKGSILKCSKCYLHNSNYNLKNKLKHSSLGSLHYLRNYLKRKKLKNYHVVAISKRLKEILKINNIKSKAIYLPIDPIFLKNDSNKFNNYFTYTGNYDWLHGMDLIIKSRKYTKLNLKTAGWGVLTRKIKHTNIQDQGKLNSPSKIKQLVKDSYAFLHPILHNNYGVSLTEAMALGKTPIAINRGFSKEIITDRKNGLLIEPTPKSLASAMQYLWDNENENRKLGKNAKKTIEEKFHPDIIFKEYLKLYENILQ